MRVSGSDLQDRKARYYDRIISDWMRVTRPPLNLPPLNFNLQNLPKENIAQGSIFQDPMRYAFQAVSQVPGFNLGV